MAKIDCPHCVTAFDAEFPPGVFSARFTCANCGHPVEATRLPPAIEKPDFREVIPRFDFFSAFFGGAVVVGGIAFVICLMILNSAGSGMDTAVFACFWMLFVVVAMIGLSLRYR